MPSAQTFSYVILLFLLISGLGILQVGVKTNQIATPHGQSETAFYLANYSTARGLASPENYVFSPWGANRAYNYFVSGDSQSYGYAQSNYDEFLTSSDPASWYDRLSPRRFVVVTPRASQTNSDQLGSQLYIQNGNPSTPAPGLAHYRLIYISPDEKYKAFELVPGAVIKGQHQPNSTITAETSVTVPGGSFSYPSEIAADSEGNFSLRVPYPGTYQVGEQQVRVSEDAIYNGSTITIGK
jgi:dolichyl-diphosphooligosaccharide--protein glycosyltransferase